MTLQTSLKTPSVHRVRGRWAVSGVRASDTYCTSRRAQDLCGGLVQGLNNNRRKVPRQEASGIIPKAARGLLHALRGHRHEPRVLVTSLPTALQL